MGKGGASCGKVARATDKLTLGGDFVEFSIGDKVRILDVAGILFGDKYWRNGDITVVTELVDGNPKEPFLARTIADDDDVDTGLVILENELPYVEIVEKANQSTEPATVEQIDEAIAKLEKQREQLIADEKSKIKVGDWVRCIKNLHDYEEGRAYRVESVNSDCSMFIVNDGCCGGNMLNNDGKYFVKIDNPTAHDRAGRKKDEYHVGDLINITNFDGISDAAEFLRGPGIKEVTEVEGEYYIQIRAEKGDGSGDFLIVGGEFKHIELVATAESRVDDFKY